jgi:DNA (cytosine-5)-methyltransferase 1
VITKSQLTAIDLYSGSGAVTQGLKDAGFSVLAAVDFDKNACETYRVNHPDVTLMETDITTLEPAELAHNAGISGSIDLLIVCAPCQPFSTQNKKRESDPRARLILESTRFVKAFSPKMVFFENVPGLASSPLIEELRAALSEIEYELSAPMIHNAADFGVPQRRARCLMVASRKLDSITAFAKAKSSTSKTRKTVRNAIGKLAALSSGESDPNDPLHFAAKHSQIAIERLKHIPHDGGSRHSLPSNLTLKCHTSQHKFSDVYGRLKWDDVAPTLTTGCTDVTKGRFAHPVSDRAITLREAALLQTFPKSYKFVGNKTQIARQIGNAVPVKMMKILAGSLRKVLEQHDTHTKNAK